MRSDPSRLVYPTPRRRLADHDSQRLIPSLVDRSRAQELENGWIDPDGAVLADGPKVASSHDVTKPVNLGSWGGVSRRIDHDVKGRQITWLDQAHDDALEIEV